MFVKGVKSESTEEEKYNLNSVDEICKDFEVDKFQD